MKTDTWERKIGAAPGPATEPVPVARTEVWRERLAGFVWLVFGTLWQKSNRFLRGFCPVFLR